MGRGHRLQIPQRFCVIALSVKMQASHQVSQIAAPRVRIPLQIAFERLFGVILLLNRSFERIFKRFQIRTPGPDARQLLFG